MGSLQRKKASPHGTPAHTAWQGRCGLLGPRQRRLLSSIKTPLPDLTPTVTSSISQPDRQKAVEELNKKGATHEQDAEKQIEELR